MKVNDFEKDVNFGNGWGKKNFEMNQRYFGTTNKGKKFRLVKKDETKD